ncbi:tetratricopeptide repeat protein [bacterium]|nr:tetratricopeptide repeat protein [bacterium]
MSIRHRYAEALALFSSLADSFPKHPAPPFFTAAVYQSMMLDLESKRWSSSFYTHIDSAIHLAEKNSHDRWHRFYLGAALSYKGYQLARDKKYLPAISQVVRSVKIMNQLLREDSSFCDPLLGVGNYLYWRSKAVAWLPLVPDKRKQGMEQVRQACSCAQLSRWAAFSSYIWMMIEEKKYTEAVALCRRGLMQFPESRFFLWPLAESLFRHHDYAEAREVYEILLTSVAAAEPNNHYNEIVLHWKLAQCEQALGRLPAAQAHARRVLELRPDEEVRNRAEDEKKGARKLLEPTSAE